MTRRLAVLASVLMVLVSAQGWAAVLKFELDDEIATTGRGRNQLSRPSGLAIWDNELLVVADSEEDTLVLFDDNGKWVRTVGRPNGVGGVELDAPGAVTVDSIGRIWVVDAGNDRVVALSRQGGLMDEIGGKGRKRGRFRSPEGLTVDHEDRIYVADRGNRRIQVFSRRGALLDVWEEGLYKGARRLAAPRLVAYSDEGDGYIWVVNQGSATLEKFDLKGRWQADLDIAALLEEGQKVEIVDLEVEQVFNRMFISDSASGSVLVVSWRGKLLTRIDLPTSLEGGAIAIDRRLNVFVADANQDRVLVYDRK